MIIFLYVDYLFLWHFFKIYFEISGTTVGRPYPTVNPRAYHPTANYSYRPFPRLVMLPPSSSRSVVALANQTHDRPSYFCNRPSFVYIFYKPSPSSFLDHRVSPFPSLFQRSLFSNFPSFSFENEAKIQDKASKKPISTNPPIDAEKFITRESKRLYKDVCSEIKLAHRETGQKVPEVHYFFSLLCHFCLSPSCPLMRICSRRLLSFSINATVSPPSSLVSMHGFLDVLNLSSGPTS